MAINQDISNLPTPPSRSDSPSDFSDKADSFLGSLPTFQSELNTYADQLNSTQSEVNTSESNAEASAQAAADSADTAEAFSDAAIAVVNAELWDSATVYNETDAVVGSDGNTYRSLINSNVGNNPVNDDGTKWRNLTSAEKATLTKTFASGEEVSLDLSSPVPTAPVVSATKEVPQVGVTNNSWDVAPDGSNFTLHDTAYSTTLTPSDASADGTFTLGTGSFAAEDVGKRIEGNGGFAFLTATDGSYIIDTPFNDTSTIAAGDWSMFALDVESAAAGLTMTKIEKIYQIQDALYTGNSFPVASQDNIPLGIFFKPDGTKMYITGQGSGNVYEYNLSTAFNVATASYSGTSFSPSSQTSFPIGLFFRNDGTSMYLLGDESPRTMYQYNLSSPWSISSASYSGNSFSVDSQDTAPRSFFIRQDGNKMYLSGDSNNAVFEYDLSISWDISSASYSNKSFSVSSETTGPKGISFKSDGSEFYIANPNSDNVLKYNLSTPWDISSSSYSGISIDISSQDGNIFALFVDNEGKNLYFTGNDNDRVFQYKISQSTFPTSANHTAITSTSTNTEFWTDINSMTADDASNDGSVFYAVSTDDRTTWKIIDDAEGTERAIVRNNAGTWEYNDASDYTTETWVAASENDEFYALEEAVNIDTAQIQVGYGLENGSYDNVSFSVLSEDGAIRDHEFNNDGTKLFTAGILNDNVYQYSLSTPFDISTMSYDSVSFDVSSQTTNPSAVKFNSDGTKMYVAEAGSLIYQYSLSSGFDISSASYSNKSVNLSSQVSDIRSIYFKNDGSKLFVAGGDADGIFEYSLSTNYDIETASYSGKFFDVEPQDGANFGLYFSNDGTKFFVLGLATLKVYKYNLGTPWDISTASYAAENIDISGQETNARGGVSFSDDGKKMFIIGQDSDSIHQYSTVGVDSINRMDAAQLNAVSDANHYTLGDDLDLAVTLTMRDSGSTSPTSDGVAINYDAQARDEGAAIGTDYEWYKGTNSSVVFKALSNENFKIRVV